MRWLLAAVCCCLGLLAVSAKGQEKLDFNRDIRPILSDKCFKCHGFDGKNRQAGLRLDEAAGATTKLESGAVAVVPGKSAESELVKRVLSTDANLKMPPASTGKTLNDAEIAKLKRWIDEGAEFKPHWSFIPPQKAAPPAVKNAANVRNAIDNFLIARLEKEGLAPSPIAEKATLLRRVTLDLTGLPPTPAEIDAFLADNEANAFEKVVDRLLKSPRFGEHQARYWLDVARYGDTHGLHLDNERAIWLYRDYVINAFNNNKPFDQFIVEQMAGDLLPNATVEQKIATGFNRCNVTTSEGGSINDEVLVRYAVDRVETMSTVFLGLTLGCAVCHDHKYDPVTQKEFYQLYAFFNAAADAAMDGNALLPPPFLKVPTADQENQLKAYDQQLAEVRKQLEAELAKVEYTDPGPATPATAALEAKEFVWIDDDAPAGAQLQGNSPWEWVTKDQFAVFSGNRASKRSGDGVTQHFFTGANPGLKIGEGDKLFAYVYLDPNKPPEGVMLQFNDGSWEHRAFWGEDKINFGGSDPTTPNHLKMGPLPKAGEWVRLEVEAAKVGLAPGATLNGWAFTQFSGTVYWDKAGSVTKTPQNGQTFESLAEWDAYERAQAQSKLPQPVQGAIKTEPDKRNDDQKKQIRNYFLQNVYAKTRPIFEPLDKQIADLTKKRTDVENAVPASLVMADLPQPRETHLLVRGQYDKKGDKVEAGIPTVLGNLPEGAPKNRLGLAKWLTAPNHPLTARVTVNRFWQQFFGLGLVKTAEDFGSQGQMPTHPELLDWLSRDFMETGWDMKRFIKQLVMSGAYQQSSRVTPELLQKDPGNELVSRGARFRMDGEVVRDSALSMCGLLVEKVGGKSVKPYQPEGIWESVAFQGSNTQNFKPDAGESLYRRSMYTFWKRTAPPPNMMTFDAPSREACVVRRARTNTPLQALVLMNDRQYVEAAKFFAQRAVKEGGNTPDERLTYAFRLATARKPLPDEMAVLLKVFQKHLARFQADPESAKKLLAVGDTATTAAMLPEELAAYTLVANLILNLDETVTKE